MHKSRHSKKKNGKQGKSEECQQKNEAWDDMADKSSKDDFPLSRFKIPLPKPLPNPDCNFCCIYFDGTKWEKTRHRKSSGHFKKNSTTTTASQTNSREKKVSPETSKSRAAVTSTSGLCFRSGKRPELKNKQIQTDLHFEDLNKELQFETKQNQIVNSSKSELLKKIELHKKELEQKYSAQKVKGLIQKIQNNPHINDNVLNLIRLQKIPHSKRVIKKKPERRFVLSKQTLPLIEITSTETAFEEHKDKCEAPPVEPRPQLPHRRISERELVAIFENTRKFNNSVSFEKHEYKPNRPQIPRRILTAAQKLSGDMPKSRPTIPRRKVTDSPLKQSIEYLDKSPNEPAQVPPAAVPDKINLSDLFLKLMNEKKTQPQTCRERGVNVPSISNITGDNWTAVVTDEKKLKTLFTLSTTGSCVKEEIIREENVPVQEINVFSVKCEKNVQENKKLECRKIVQVKENNQGDANKIIDSSVNIDQFCTTIKHYLAKKQVSDVTKNLSQLSDVESDGTPTPTPTPTEPAALKDKIRNVFLNKMGNNLLHNACALHRSVSKLLRAQTCPSMNEVNEIETGPSEDTNIDTSVQRAKSNDSGRLNNRNKADSTDPTEIASCRALDRKWTAGSIYNSTLLFTKVNKDCNKDSSFKKRMEYYRKLRTKQKKLNNETYQTQKKCQNESKCISNCQKPNKISKQNCPVSKSVYCSRIEKLVSENLNFSARINVGCDPKPIDTIVPVHCLQSDSEVENVSCSSLESGIQSMADNCNSAWCRSEEQIHRNSGILEPEASKAFTIAQCSIATPTLAILTDIIKLNQDRPLPDSCRCKGPVKRRNRIWRKICRLLRGNKKQDY